MCKTQYALQKPCDIFGKYGWYSESSSRKNERLRKGEKQRSNRKCNGHATKVKRRNAETRVIFLQVEGNLRQLSLFKYKSVPEVDVFSMRYVVLERGFIYL